MSKAKVLLVDEEDTILDAYSFLLRKEGYCVLTAYNGGKAFAAVNKSHCIDWSNILVFLKGKHYERENSDCR